MHSSRWALVIRRTSASLISSRSAMPRLAATTEAVVQAMPFCTNSAL